LHPRLQLADVYHLLLVNLLDEAPHSIGLHGLGLLALPRLHVSDVCIAPVLAHFPGPSFLDMSFDQHLLLLFSVNAQVFPNCLGVLEHILVVTC
jgi:hypothetical protein